ncbi:MAG: cyclic nucleotide-binding domain-containing protein [Myxococcales bacterium]|nr:cyclic nucleotide-binding domain-containing protein [Myxococcales bacterium]MCB9650162.1 cyclic nucleotide-binding domain-containing protein [Deltaproteobacteria bacterium]
MVDVSAEACLARARAFERMDEEGRRRLASLAQRVALAPGEVLMREGEPGDAFYLLVHGMLRVEAEDLSAQPRRVGTIEPGAVLGEIGVVTSEPRTATVTADTAAEVLRFELLGVLAVLKDYPQVLAELNRLGLERSEATLEQLMD